MSPPLVVAYALAGRATLDIARDAIREGADGEPVYLKDLWPSGAEIDAALAASQDAADIPEAFARAEASPAWCELAAPEGARFPWDPDSTYLRRPPFAAVLGQEAESTFVAHPLIVVGDDVTTDHISPAGAIAPESDAGRHLIAKGQPASDLNVYAARRGNWEAMIRGMFANRSVANLLAPDLPSGHTIHAPTGDVLPIWRAAQRYREAGEPLVVVAGERYGMGSSRDWAAKGLHLLGVRAVLAVSFERIHRSNLIGMGILPLQLPRDRHPLVLSLRSGDRIAVRFPAGEALKRRQGVAITLRRSDGWEKEFEAIALLETSLDIELIRAGGFIPLNLARQLTSRLPRLSD
jgi:aconitate hydratase